MCKKGRIIVKNKKNPKKVIHPNWSFQTVSALPLAPVFPPLPTFTRACFGFALVTGFLGALTTFSSFSAEVVQMLLASRYVSALVTASLHLLGSLLFTLAGIKTIEMIWVR
jgi:hypothetical protein